MADITTNSTRKKSGKRIVKKQLRVDLTAMVDLGFVLITFFVFTATLSELKSMNLYLPKGEKAIMHVAESNALTVILDGEDKVHYYQGNLLFDGSNLYHIHFNDVRNLLITLKEKHPDLFVNIQSTDHSNFKNVIDMLDEMTINQIGSYTITYLDEQTKNLL